MHTKGDGLGNAQGPVDAPSWSVVTEDDHARFVKEQAPDKVVAHAPERRQFLHREMPLERGLGRRHALGMHVSKRRDNPGIGSDHASEDWVGARATGPRWSIVCVLGGNFPKSRMSWGRLAAVPLSCSRKILRDDHVMMGPTLTLGSDPWVNPDPVGEMAGRLAQAMIGCRTLRGLR